MSTLHKFKAYFGMVPLDEYEDDYLEEPMSSRGRPMSAADGYGPESAYHKGAYDNGGYDKGSYDVGAYQADEYEEPDRYTPPPMRHAPRLEPLPPRAPARMQSTATTRGSLAVDSRVEARAEVRRNASLCDEGGSLSKITTLRPRDYSEARTIGEHFRDGVPVIMDLVEMSNADAKRLVDFAAGLAFALRGSFDKVATKVFLLSPADIDVSAEERRRIAETGFYNK
ncbi:cell division protein SepF [Speluncibacter jeojiensis]|uniref:Cell division protein SepF n=1 Tax=Speluncibacter jeojiensis TaxID=2710754 RepID=A0A9X4LYE2_9ACTN|nr:cell division protein SepF [Corynebacteriales bacterium D3-21]